MADVKAGRERRSYKCPYCGGTGNSFIPANGGTCPYCKGFRRVTKTEREAIARRLQHQPSN